MNYEIQDPKIYTEEIKKLKTSDRANAETTFNPLIKKLVNNDAYLKEHQDAIREELDAHMGNDRIHVTEVQKVSWTNKAEKTTATGATAGLMSASDKDKLDGIQAGAEINQNAIQTLRAGGVNIQANEKTSQVELVAGNNVSIVGDNTTKKITIIGPNAVKNPLAIAIQLNGVTAANYDGSIGKTVNITPNAIGAAAADHSHSYLPLTGGTVNGGLFLSGSHQFVARHVDGSITGGMNGELFLNYNRTANIHLGTSGGGTISSDGRQYSGNSATATNADMVDGKHAADILRMGGKHLAGQGVGGGYSFVGDGAEDTGMFSDSDGDLYFLKNGIKHNPITDRNIGNQSVNYANTAGTANNIAWNNISGKPSTYPSSGHIHDDRYYTEAEVNSLLNGKSDINHTHTTAQISNFPASLPANGGNADTVDGYHFSAGNTDIGVGTALSDNHIYLVFE